MKLFTHQQTALDFLVKNFEKNINSAHNDPAGTGKTLPAFLACRQFTGPGQIVLWVTLASAKFQVESEIKRFGLNFRPIVLTGTKTTRLNAISEVKNAPDDIILVINYEQVLGHVEELAGLPIAVIVTDECTRLGNQKNKTWKLLYALAKHTKARRIALSGTPITNNPLEAWPLFEYLNPGSMGSYYTFAATYMARTQFAMFGRIRHERLPGLAARLKPYYIRREREALLPDLPDLLEEVVPVELGAAERKLYDQLVMDIMLEVKEANRDRIKNPENMGMGIVKFSKLRQLCIDPQLLGSGNVTRSKLEALKEFVSTLGPAKALVFTEFASAVSGILTALPPGSALVITGAVSQADRAKIVARFQTDPNVKYLVGTRAIEMALNLQAADFVIHVDPPLTYASYDQRVSRARRQGRTDKVVSVRLIARATIEEKIYRLIEGKRELSLAAMPYTELIRELL